MKELSHTPKQAQILVSQEDRVIIDLKHKKRTKNIWTQKVEVHQLDDLLSG